MNHLPTDALATRPTQPVYAFQACDLRYGIDVHQIQEVSPCPPITPVPQAPPVVRGLTNMRSHIYLALDMRALVGRAPAAIDAECRLVVIKPSITADLAIIVERGGDIVHVRPNQIESPPPALGKGAEPDLAAALFPRVYRMNDELMTIMDLAVIANVVQSHFAMTARGTGPTRGATYSSREIIQ
ncbi:MAG: chemotaxis protein CheW [Phycisphaerales bacterium]